jgi:hypothetical protein
VAVAVGGAAVLVGTAVGRIGVLVLVGISVAVGDGSGVDVGIEVGSGAKASVATGTRAGVSADWYPESLPGPSPCWGSQALRTPSLLEKK